jgi:hypothetical protein
MPTRLPDVSFPTTPVRYPAIIVDSYWGTTQQVQLKRTQGVQEYDITFVEGTLAGGTTPAWAQSKLLPLVAHWRIDADNTTIHDADAQLDEEYEWLSRGITPDGLNFVLTMCDVDYHTGNLLEHSIFPSFAFSQNVLSITFPALASVTTGTPTSSTGTTMYITEVAVPRSLMTFKPLLVKRLQTSATLSATGDNIFATLLPQTGAYKSALFFISTSSSVSYANYANGSNTICDYIRLRLNDIVTDTEAWFGTLRSQDQVTFQRTPDTGYAMRVWMGDNDTSKLLALGDTTTVTGVELDVHTTGTGTVEILKALYA